MQSHKKSPAVELWCSKSFLLAKSQAGPRYSPGIDPNFPSLPIDRLLNAYSGLVRAEHLANALNKERKKLSKLVLKSILFANSQSLPPELQHTSALVTSALAKLDLEIGQIVNRYASSFERLNIAAAILLVDEVQHHISSLKGFITENTKLKEGLVPNWWRANNQLEYLRQEARDLSNTLWEMRELLDGSAFKYCNDPVALLLGRAGNGKTHFLCDLAAKRIECGQATIITLAGNLPVGNLDPWTAIIKAIGIDVSPKDFLASLITWARGKRKRVLIIVDAINEGDIQSWKSQLPQFIAEIRSTPEVALLMSCRTQYEQMIFDQDTFNEIETLVHPGFAEIEFKAQEMFFNHFNLPNPTVPLLTDEFANPLFLKLFCASLEYATVKQKHRQIKDIGSGSKCMTFIFEEFIKAKQSHINRLYGNGATKKAFRKPDWLWSAGNQPGIVKRFAASLAVRNCDYLSLADLDSIILEYIVNPLDLSAFRQILLSEGVFSKGVRYIDNTPIEVVEFSYQRVSDYLVVREILNAINCQDKSQTLQLHKSLQSVPNRLEALQVEYPVRSNGREVLSSVPPKETTRASLEAFISGLYWRDSSAFTEQTNRIVTFCLSRSELRNQTLEALVSLGIRYSHPLNAVTLDRFLSRMKLCDRDLFWSEFLRCSNDSSTVQKLIRFCFQSGQQVQDAKSATCFIITLKWFLTSSDRDLRDKATKALVILGESFPELLFNQALRSLAENDPYVPERMFAACYGMCLRLHGNLSRVSELRILLSTNSQRLYKLMFANNAKYATTHVLLRDYCRRIIGLGVMYKKQTIPAKNFARTTPRFADGGIRNWKVLEVKADEASIDSAAIGNDFGNYTLGRLVRDRRNYDFENAEYQIVRRNILWRVHELGYDAVRFREIDRSIARGSAYGGKDRPGKVDRYGKKYSWIAYFELYGYRMDNGLLDKDEVDLRPSDCDIDPSFPNDPRTETIIDIDFLGNRRKKTLSWITHARIPSFELVLENECVVGLSGPWLLIDGSIRQEDFPTRRMFDLFVHSRVVKRDQLDVLRNLPFESVEGAREFSFNPTSLYSYAGEVGWSDMWPPNEPDKLVFEVGMKRVKQVNDRFVVYQSGKRLSDEASIKKIDELAIELGRDPSLTELTKLFRKREITVSRVITQRNQKTRQFAEIVAESLVRNFGWESYHSSLLDGHDMALLSNQLCKFARLSMQVPNWDFVDANGAKAAIVSNSAESFGQGQKLIFLRKDILDRYLEHKNAVLVWSVSCERRYLYKDEDGHFKHPSLEEGKSRQAYKFYYYLNGRMRILGIVEKNK